MPKGKRHTPEQIVAILRRSESGETVATVCRETNISAATFHRWKSQYGGMELSDLQQLRGLRDENARLKRLVADQALHIQMLKEVNGKNGKPVAETPGGQERRGRGAVFRSPGPSLLRT
jgi:putative transposase